MALEISKSFVVRASPDAAWNLLTDPARVARCLPGAQITEKVDDRTYTGTITVKVGPVAASYKGTMKFEQLDPGARTAAITASGQDVRGKGGADMRMTSRLVERAPGETEVQITSQVNVMGILAQFGRGMIQDVSDQMFDKFVAAARAELETAEVPQAPASAAEVPASGRFGPSTGSGPSRAQSRDGETGSVSEAPSPRPQAQEAAPPIEVLSFGSAVVGRAAGRAFKRPIVWVGVGIVLFVAFWLMRR
jgi:carbon monoxide dehydrogenase subunit G